MLGISVAPSKTMCKRIPESIPPIDSIPPMVDIPPSVNFAMSAGVSTISDTGFFTVAWVAGAMIWSGGRAPAVGPLIGHEYTCLIQRSEVC